jgi:hypothetical protein
MLPSLWRRAFPAVLAATIAAGATSPAPAQSPPASGQPSSAPAPSPSPSGPLSPDKLRGIVTGLGYEIKDEKTVSIDTNGKYVLNIIIIPSDDQTNLYLYINLGTFSAEQATKQAPKLLEFNSEHKEYFSFKATDQNGEIVYLNGQIRGEAVSPQVLRVAIDDLKYEAETFDTLWNPSLWK